jgi:hypothetical protein
MSLGTLMPAHPQRKPCFPHLGRTQSSSAEAHRGAGGRAGAGTSESQLDITPVIVRSRFGLKLRPASSAVGIVLGIFELAYRIAGNAASVGSVVLIALLPISGSQFTLFAMWFDMESNEDLR